ncbi:MAG TPA: hypothetical protein PKA10_00720 [Selenomonadales bacterium]|nr:hypothetical protein [Selenomonadales bacterium]
MNSKKNWLVAAGLVAAVTASGMAMAPVNAEKQEAPQAKTGAGHGQFKGDRQAFKAEVDKLLAFLKIDEATFKAEMKDGKTLVAIAKEQGISEQELKAFLVEQMTERIDEGVAAGRIPADRAEKMKTDMDKHVTAMINGKGPFGHGPMAGHAPFANEKLLALLKIDADTLKSEMQDGKTLAAIAKEHGVSEKKLKDFMVSEITQRIDADVKAGRIPADRAEKMKADMDKRVTAMINGKGPMFAHKPMAGRAFLADGKLAAFLKTDADTLKSEMQGGKTLVAIAGERGVSEQALKAFLVEQMTERIDEGVKAGRIPADRAEKMKAGMDQHVTDMINGKGPMHKHEARDNS